MANVSLKDTARLMQQPPSNGRVRYAFRHDTECVLTPAELEAMTPSEFTPFRREVAGGAVLSSRSGIREIARSTRSSTRTASVSASSRGEGKICLRLYGSSEVF